jgi:hypothetical protein
MKPGSIVICVAADFTAEVAHLVPNLPKQGVKYVVRDIVPDPLGFNPPGITLEGIINPMGWTPCIHGFVLVEFTFMASRFRLINEEKPDWEDAFNIEKPLPSIQN